MFNGGYGNNGDFEGLARQYWSAWGDAMRQAGLGAMAPAPAPPPPGGWQQAMDWWSQLLPRAPSQANDALGRFNQQARDLYGQMQQVAAQFAGRDSTAAEVTQAWRQALGAGSGSNPFPEMFKAMSGKGLHGLDDWIAQAKPFLDSIQQDSQRWLHLPAFGQHREHQERLQALTQSQLDYQQRSQAFNTLMAKCAQRAFAVFEEKLAEREDPGRQISSARGLFDLWIDAAEQAYSEVALSAEFRTVSGALTNAQMRLRAGIQGEVELLAGQFGMPTRTEVDSAHRKIAELERALRRAAAATIARPARAAKASAMPGAAASAAEPAEEKLQPRSASVRRKRKATAAKKSAPRSTRKGAGKKQVPRKTVARKRALAPATVEEKRAPTKARRASTASAKNAAAQAGRSAKSTTDATKANARKSSSGKQSRSPDKKVAQAPALRAAAAGNTVSMKDWVARNSAAAESGAGASDKGLAARKKGARK